MAEKELKPCPFCGGEACIQDSLPIVYGNYKVLVVCKKCSASVCGVATLNFRMEHTSCNGYNLAKAQAVEAWNRRADKAGNEKVRHGKWLPTNRTEHKRCSVCDVISFIALYPCINIADYCPHCGAKMDEE